jgi:phenylpropionate dioxygenase-like ring-hydroxylating dioxygenase large terminal subunit
LSDLHKGADWEDVMNDTARVLANARVRPDFIPASDYVSPEFDRLEREKLWPRVWQIACREEEIPRAGDYVNYEIGEDSILVIRSRTDEIKAFHNVCSHRGRRLRDDARGNVPILRCNYHAWRYDLNGKLIDMPSADDWKDCPRFSEADTALVPARVGAWAGFVWINMNPDAEPLHDFLKPLPEKLDNFEIDKCRLNAYWTLIVPANWKVVLEAFVEGYHTTGTHPQMLKYGEPYVPAPIEDQQGTRLHATHTSAHPARTGEHSHEAAVDPRVMLHSAVEELYTTLRAMILEPSMAAARRVLTEIPEGTAAEVIAERYFEFQREETLKTGAEWPSRLTRADLWSTDWQIFPNSSVLPTVDGALWYRMRPNGDDRDSCIFDIWVLGRYAPGKEPKAEQEIFESFEAFEGRSPFLEQDFKNLIAVQKGMRSRAWRGARPSPVQEVSVYNLHRVLHDYLFNAASS